MRRFFSLLVIVAFLVTAMPVLAQGPAPPSVEELIKLQIHEAEKRILARETLIAKSVTAGAISSKKRDTEIAKSVTAGAISSKKRDTAIAKSVTGLAKGVRDEYNGGARDITSRIAIQTDRCNLFRIAIKVKPDYFNENAFVRDVEEMGITDWVKKNVKYQELSQKYAQVSICIPKPAKVKEWVRTAWECLIPLPQTLDEGSIANRVATQVKDEISPAVRDAKKAARKAADDAKEARRLLAEAEEGVKGAEKAARQSKESASDAAKSANNAASLLEKDEYVSIEKFESTTAELRSEIEKKVDKDEYETRISAVENAVDSVCDALGSKLAGKDDKARVKIVVALKKRCCDFEKVNQRLLGFQWKESHRARGIYGAAIVEGYDHLAAQMLLRSLGYSEKRIKDVADDFGSKLLPIE